MVQKFATISAVVLVAMTVAAHASTITLYGDGQHDDTCSLKKWMMGEDVVWPDGNQVGKEIVGKRFYITSPFIVPYIKETRFLFGSEISYKKGKYMGYIYDSKYYDRWRSQCINITGICFAGGLIEQDLNWHNAVITIYTNTSNADDSICGVPVS